MEIQDLAHFQAFCNALSLVLLTVAYFFIRSGRREAHKRTMIGAITVSAIFLASYLTYHYHIGQTPFSGEGFIRPVYFTILIIHILAAVICLPMIITTILRAWKKRFDRHKAIARYTLPLWLFVCVSGLVVYAMAFHIYPPSA
ncbi:DUF420 domain-containing protein [Aestuariispira insulae]|uniref:Putative membrane protein n=1 Tax=Aestuariispira insulae TaxID=1461337 RepID=A0A3D9HNG4_9PROT|nr:DUF420 domain-containing protein [Aestuariispira insulae]RED50841.1 putative membrane protein [Aestuariispira insulae]